MNPLIGSRLTAGIRAEDKRRELREKYGDCKACNGRSYVGGYEDGHDCYVCKGTGANLPKEDKEK